MNSNDDAQQRLYDSSDQHCDAGKERENCLSSTQARAGLSVQAWYKHIKETIIRSPPNIITLSGAAPACSHLQLADNAWIGSKHSHADYLWTLSTGKPTIFSPQTCSAQPHQGRQTVPAFVLVDGAASTSWTTAELSITGNCS